MKKTELLAPAGNLLKMKTAFLYGADAVYLGLPDFSLRARINEFDRAGIREAVRYAKTKSKKVYATINIFAHNRHLKSLPSHLRFLRALPVDALIVSDPGVISMIKKVWPRATVHLSTQANCTNLEAVRFWQKQGVERIILGREVTLEEIREIHKAAPKMELEYFVHGAMCLAYSGRCFLSRHLVGRSANLGDCAQPCRWEYESVRVRALGHEEELELVSEANGSYILNSRDLCLIGHLGELQRAGITSFKIEGRAKSVYYQAIVCGAYRRALDLLAKKSLSQKEKKKELDYLAKELETKLVHRGYSTGFLLGGRGEQNTVRSHEESAWEFCGQVTKVEESGKAKRIYFRVHNTVRAGEALEIIRPSYDIMKIRPGVLWDAENGRKISEAHGGGGSRTAFFEVSSSLGDIPVLSVLCRHKSR